ncbi:MAG: TolC family protein [Spirochaetes bacterium]|nr:TolC family protein [Spirochaetota bacterium]
MRFAQRGAGRPLPAMIAAVAAMAVVLRAGGLAAEDVYTWDECVRVAGENHPDLRQASALVEKAKSSRGATRSAYLPQLSLDAAAQRSSGSSSSMQQSSTRSSTYTSSDSSRTTYSYGISGTQLVFDGMKTLYDVKAAGSQVDEARFKYMVTSSTVRYQLRNAFVLVLKTQEEVGLARDIVSLRKKNLELVQMRYNAGREHLGSLLTSKANYSYALQQYEQVKSSLQVYQKQLSYRMGLKSCRPLRVQGEMAVAVETGTRPDMEVIASANPTLLKAIQEKRSAELTAKAYQSGFYPTVSLYGSLERSDTRFPPGSTQWSMGMKASYPLFEGGASYYQYRRAQDDVTQLAAGAESTRQSLMLSLEQRWNDLLNTRELVPIRREYLRAAEERSKIAQSQYNLGLIVYDTWIIIDNEYVNAKKALLQAQVDAMTAEAEWIYAKGEMLNYANP